jgi:hypothetical protein
VFGIDEGEIVAKPFEAQFCTTPSSKNEGSYFVQRLQAELNSGSPETDIEIEKALVNMIREAAITGQEEKVWAYFGLARKERTKKLAIRLLTQMQLYDLAQKLSDRLVSTNKPAIPASKGNQIPANMLENVPKPLAEKPQVTEEPDRDNPFKTKPQAQADLFASLSEVTKRKADPLPVAPKKKRL